MKTNNSTTQNFHVRFFIGSDNKTLIIRARTDVTKLNRFRGTFKSPGCYSISKNEMIKGKTGILNRVNQVYKTNLKVKGIKKLIKVIVDCK
jgi:hypothetical protein